MAGHSAWKNIKHKKAANDARRGKVWSKCARAIIVASRVGGGDPETNLSLRYAIDEARAENMPRDTIEKAIKKGAGDLQGEDYEGAMYEGYGPGGVAFMVEILTNNRNRTSPDIKGIFEHHGGKLGGPGSVSHSFRVRGQLYVPKAVATEEAMMEVALEAGAQDVIDEGDYWRVLSEPGDFIALRAAIETAKLPIENAGIAHVPNTSVTCTGTIARQVLALVEELEEHEDVQKIYANFEMPDAELAAMGK